MAENQSRLITIPISHYCEKARWALERAKLPYREEALLQGFHFFSVYRAGKSDSAPVLVTSEGVFNDSTKILLWVDSKISSEHKLYPKEFKNEIEGFEDYLDETFGVAGRLWMYTYMLHQVKAFLKFSKFHNVPFYERLLMPLLMPLMKSKLSEILEMKS